MIGNRKRGGVGVVWFLSNKAGGGWITETSYEEQGFVLIFFSLSLFLFPPRVRLVVIIVVMRSDTRI